MSQSRDKQADDNPNLSRSHAELSRMILQGRSFSGLERNCSFLNTSTDTSGLEKFATVSSVSGLDFPDDGRALAVVDWDHDGDLDIWLSARNAPRVRLMQNRVERGNNYLQVHLQGDGEKTNRDAIGARVEVVVAGQSSLKNIQTLRAGEGFLSQDSKWLHFGLGQADSIGHLMVSWPGGLRETFTGLEVNKRYELVQGAGKPVIAESPIKRQIEYLTSEPIIPQPAAQVRIPLMTKMAMATLPIKNYDGKNQVVEAGFGGPALVTLWASWCPSCKAELTEFTHREKALAQAGIGVLALSVDGLGDERSDPGGGRKLLDELGFPYPVGLATRELVQSLQEIHDLLVPLKLPLPVPASFLFDGKGQLSVIYKGRVRVDQVIADAEKIQKEESLTLQDTSPFLGKALPDDNLERVVKANRVRTFFQRGVKLADTSKFNESVIYNLKALELFPESYKIHFNLGAAYSNLKKYVPAIYHLQKSMEVNPDFQLPKKMIGKIFFNTGELDKARENYLSYVLASPEDIESLNALAVIASRAGKNDEAEVYLQRIVAVAPNYVEARYNLGTIYLLQNRDQEAEKSFLKILTIQPNYPDVLYNLGVIAERAGERERAANLFKGELRNSPQSLKAMVGMGRILEHRGEYEQAKTYYGRAVQLQPGYFPAQQGLNRVTKTSPGKGG